MFGFRTPILFLIFNRPEETARVFAAIRALKPRYLFIAADGPRLDRPGEEERVQETRQIATQVDWKCDVKTFFREKNHGCGKAVSSAISWFFSEVEEGIILEDDCLPHRDFFIFCQILLAKYRTDQRVATIAGTHFLPPELPHQQSYYSSKYFQMWGWASWRRTWQTYDFDLSSLTNEAWIDIFKQVHPNPTEFGYWREIYRTMKAGHIDTWDFQMFFSCWKTKANHIMPGRNLISNIGYGANATHTNFASPMANLPTHSLKIDRTPVNLEPSVAVDDIIFYLRFLESMNQTWWVEQVLSPEGKLSHAREEIQIKNKYIREMEIEIIEKRRQLRCALDKGASRSS